MRREWVLLVIVLLFVILALIVLPRSKKSNRIFNPIKCEHEFIRLGSQNDGGYVILDDSFGSSVVLGYGVSNDCSFENNITERFGIRGYIFDHTIDEPPKNMSDKITFIKEGISDNDDEKDLKSLEYHIRKYVKDSESIILKMDVEGAEWKSLKNADLSRVSQLIIEFHSMHTADWNLIKRLNQQFYLVNIHGNNHSPLVKIHERMFPEVIECTWVRKDLINEPIEYTNMNPLNNRCDPNTEELEHVLI